MDNEVTNDDTLNETNELKERVTHFWNMTNYLTSFNGCMAKNMQMYYATNCRRYNRVVKLPEKCFGSATMCSHCCTVWKTGNHQTRLLKPKEPSKAVKKLLKNVENSEKPLHRFRKTLAKKSALNNVQKICIKCFTCKKNTFTVLKKTAVQNANQSSQNLNVSKSNNKSQGSNVATNSRSSFGQKMNSSATKSSTPKSKGKKFQNQIFKNMLHQQQQASQKKKNVLSDFLSLL